MRFVGEINKIQKNETEDLNLPEKTQSELESENFYHYVAEALDRMGEVGLAELIHAKDKKIMPLINLESRKAAITGNQAEIANSEEFDVGKHMKMRAEDLANK